MKAESELSCCKGAPLNAIILASWGDCTSAQDDPGARQLPQKLSSQKCVKDCIVQPHRPAHRDPKLGWTHYHSDIFLLMHKELKTFSWTPKSMIVAIMPVYQVKSTHPEFHYKPKDGHLTGWEQIPNDSADNVIQSGVTAISPCTVLTPP